MFDLAVAIVIGGAFGRIVTALVEGIVMPVTGVLVSGRDFSALALDELRPAQGDKEAVLMTYGTFLQATVDFIIIALVIFLAVRGMKALQRKKEEEQAAAPAPSEPTEEVKLLTEIRDALKAR